ncbi:MAG: type III-A CRISPR-associated protein Cas10/Csm1 [Bacteroidota bacterium]
MANERDIIYLAALLHDIGKFWQRADEGYQASKDLAEYPNVVKNADNICPTSQDGYFKYQHVIWTQLFFEVHEATFKKLDVYENPASPMDNLTNLSIYHHKPSTRLQAFVQLADWWASGIDRSQASDFHTEVKRGKLKFKEEPLINIFGSLNVYDIDRKLLPKPIDASAFDLQSLSLRSSILPSTEKYKNGISQASYRVLWDNFNAEFKQLPIDTLEAFNTSLYFLLKKYCWCIPASTIDFPDNSLFDHLKITAAIAHCFHEYATEQTDSFKYDRKLILKEGHRPLLLLCVDTSGIQKFIYDISSKYAAKSLKGRSFSLQLMLDEIAQLIIEKTKTTQSHIIYSSGGKFFMLLPNTQVVRSELELIENDLKRVIWEKYKGNIYICMGYEAFAYGKDLRKQDNNGKSLPTIWIDKLEKPVFLSDLWRSVSDKTAEKKYRKFKELLLDDFDDFFRESGKGGTTDVCSVTGEEVEKGITQIDDDVKISPQIKEQKEIGEDLAKHDYIILSKGKQPNLKSKPFSTLLGRNYWIMPKNELLPIDSAEVCLTAKVDLTFLQTVSAKNTAYSFRFYGGSEVALNPDKTTKTFEDLAEKKGYDFNRLAILRMDVDGLGQLFIKGFDEAKASFSAYATLSGHLDWFFSGYLNTIRSKETYKDWVNIIYSGGDDVFAVGRWDAIIAFADEVQHEFKKFTGRKDLTLSAGITIVTAKFPIAKAADLAGEAEDQAKDHTFDGQAKNAVSLFGIAVNWDKEFPDVKIWKEKIVGWLQSNTISKGLLQKLFEYYQIYDEREEYDNTKRKNNHSWKWNAAYQIARAQKDTKNEARKQALNELKTLLFVEINSEKFRFEAFIVACRWAELTVRDSKILTKNTIDNGSVN